MDLKFLGIGGAVNFEQGSNCAYIKRDNKIMLLDCGEACGEKLVKKGLLNKDTKEVLVILTHTHSDHIAGLGTLIWYCRLGLGFNVKIFCNSPSFEKTVTQILTLQGVDIEYYSFTSINNFIDINISVKRISHQDDLECFCIFLEQGNEKVLYSGDTNDIDFIKACAKDNSITHIYCEVSMGTYPVHIYYGDLKEVKNKDKFTLMHFGTRSAYNIIKQEGLFAVAEID